MYIHTHTHNTVIPYLIGQFPRRDGQTHVLGATSSLEDPHTAALKVRRVADMFERGEPGEEEVEFDSRHETEEEGGGGSGEGGGVEISAAGRGGGSGGGETRSTD